MVRRAERRGLREADAADPATGVGERDGCKPLAARRDLHGRRLRGRDPSHAAHLGAFDRAARHPRAVPDGRLLPAAAVERELLRRTEWQRQYAASGHAGAAQDRVWAADDPEEVQRQHEVPPLLHGPAALRAWPGCASDDHGGRRVLGGRKPHLQGPRDRGARRGHPRGLGDIHQAALGQRQRAVAVGPARCRTPTTRRCGRARRHWGDSTRPIIGSWCRR